MAIKKTIITVINRDKSEKTADIVNQLSGFFQFF